MIDINGADARIVGVDGSRDVVLQKNLERVRSIIRYGAGQVGFDADLFFRQIIEQGWVAHRMHGMPDAFGT